VKGGKGWVRQTTIDLVCLVSLVFWLSETNQVDQKTKQTGQTRNDIAPNGGEIEMMPNDRVLTPQHPYKSGIAENATQAYLQATGYGT
jgi:hypothetical protein